MVLYRKNENWGTKSGTYSNKHSVDQNIKALIDEIPEVNDENVDIDIIDISVRDAYIPETSTSYAKNQTKITIMYAIVPKTPKKQKVQI